jgi:hypothetical protein
MQRVLVHRFFGQRSAGKQFREPLRIGLHPDAALVRCTCLFISYQPPKTFNSHFSCPYKR